MSKQENIKNLTSVNSLCSIIKFSGDGVLEYLNNLLISDLKTLNKSRFHYSALCNPKGRVISSFFLNLNKDTSIEMICPKNMCTQLVQFFTTRKFRQKFTISEESIEKYTLHLDYHNFQNIVFSKSIENFYLGLFEAKLPWIDADNTEKFIPQHINLDIHKDVMSFSKGCYPGQEIIARMKYLGKIKKRMQLITVKSKKFITEPIETTQLVSPIIKNSVNLSYQAQIIKPTKFIS